MNKFHIFVHMTEIPGKYNTAVVFSDNLDEASRKQIRDFVDQEVFRDIRIRIMPDVHAGKGCVIGYTANLSGRVVPNLIGLDIGCGILATRTGKREIDFGAMDKFIRRAIPYGFKRNKSADVREFPVDFINRMRQTCDKFGIDFHEQLKGIGSLGGGNHFIEVSGDSRDEHWLVTHTGSRNFGLQVATWHQKKAQRLCQQKHPGIPRDFAFLEGEDREDYIADMKTAQEYASLNRKVINGRILFFLGIEDPGTQIESVHNYISFRDGIIRKGAISAHQDERIIIPFNMRDGSLIAKGKGNSEWNFSAPHGAGRVMSRNQAKKNILLKDFRESMKAVWTSTVSEKTKDEAPEAYKSKNEIMQNLRETADIIEMLRPVYNFKA